MKYEQTRINKKLEDIEWEDSRGLLESREKMKSKFKDTEIGMIPEDWEVKKIKEIDKSKDSVKTGPFGSLLHAYDYVKEGEEGVPLLLVKNFDKGRLIDPDMPKVNVKKSRNYQLFFLRKEILYIVG